MERDHDAVIELPFFRVGDVDVVEYRLDEAARKFWCARNSGARDAQERFFLDRPLVELRHAHAIGRHVIHEEVGEVLGRDDDQGVGIGVLNRLAEARESAVNGIHMLGLSAVGAASNAGRMAARSVEDQGHCSISVVIA